MLQLLSGSEFHTHSYTFPVDDLSQVGEVRRFVGTFAQHLQLTEIEAGRAAIIINELGHNLIRHARGGTLHVRGINEAGARGLEIVSIDSGPGLDPAKALLDGFSTGTTPGTGLGAIRRQSDVFDIYSSPGHGTAVLAQVYSVPPASLVYEWGAVNIPLKGETVCGDAWTVTTEDSGLNVLVADGLGHGFNANKAAKEAVRVFREQRAPRADLALQAIHQKLKSTRGAAVFVLKLNGESAEFSGVGNIRTVVCSGNTSRTLISQNGTAGLQIRSLPHLSEKIPGDALIILHSDGISSKWDLASYPGLSRRHPALVAQFLYRDFTRKTDDATLVVVRRKP